MPSSVTSLLANWPNDAAAAVEVQQRLRHLVSLTNSINDPRRVIGLDVGYDPATNTSHAVGVLMQSGNSRIIASARAQLPTTFPYIPGFLSFREVPVLLAVLEQLPKADLLMIDGQGIAHPRRFGIACHLGVLTDMPTIGVAKSRLCGHHEALGVEAGALTLLSDRGEQIGTVLRSKANCLPLYISPGHKIDQAAALAITRQWIGSYRLPEPTRLADKLSKKAERDKEPLLL